MQGYRRPRGARLIAIVSVLALFCLGPPARALDLPDPIGDILKPVLVSLSLSPTNADPDEVPPAIKDVSVSPSVVDVRSGPVTVTVSISSSDEQSGVNWLVFFATNAAMTAGGVVPPYLERTSGSANDGVWTGTFTV